MRAAHDWARIERKTEARLRRDPREYRLERDRFAHLGQAVVLVGARPDLARQRDETLLDKELARVGGDHLDVEIIPDPRGRRATVEVDRLQQAAVVLADDHDQLSFLDGLGLPALADFLLPGVDVAFAIE